MSYNLAVDNGEPSSDQQRTINEKFPFGSLLIKR